jgi:hypothetical protein
MNRIEEILNIAGALLAGLDRRRRYADIAPLLN